MLPPYAGGARVPDAPTRRRPDFTEGNQMRFSTPRTRRSEQHFGQSRRKLKTALGGLGAFGAVFAVVALVGAGAAFAAKPVTGAAFTTTNTSVDGTEHCQNGNEDVNCNIYDGKQYVWMNGGPVAADLGDGSYFFAVLEPGGQNVDPNDGGDQNLSDDYDGHANRTFSVSNGAISYAGSHDFDSNKIRLAQYADTSNPGGVYILAICSLEDGYPVDASNCKYDAFKIQEGETQPGDPLTVTKDADGAYDNTYTWKIEKSVDKTIVKQIGGTATFTYTVKATNDGGGAISNVKVTGTIKAFNPNVDDSDSTVSVSGVNVTDQLSDGTDCTVTGGDDQTLTSFETQFSYSCDLGSVPAGELDNTVTITWPEQLLDNGHLLAAGSDAFTFKGPSDAGILFTENKIDECADVTDSYAGTLGTACASDGLSKSFTYSRTIAVPQNDCQSYDNKATFTTNDTGATGDASQTVTLCGPARTGALTIGFWKTTNGQNLVKTYCNNGSSNLGTYLVGLGGGSGPFSTAPTSCSSLATYVYNILNGASATDMNKMLKAQMLGTALDVWFSGPGWTSTKVGGVKPPSQFLSHNNLGTFNMDTTAVCPMVDNLSTGTASCKNNLPSTDAQAAGAVPTSPMSMQAILDYAATTPDPFNGSTSSSVWYAGNRTKQEILKNIYDQFNNQLAFGSF
jgi:hypothetical protein